MDEPVELLHYYINVSLIMGDHTFDDYDLLEQMLEKKRIVISSIGGSRQDNPAKMGLDCIFCLSERENSDLPGAATI
jgi:hypothetical protein